MLKGLVLENAFIELSEHCPVWLVSNKVDYPSLGY